MNHAYPTGISPASRSALLPFLLLFCCVQSHAQDTTPTPAVPVRIMGITITGNAVTRDRIILRELVVKEGDVLSDAVLFESLERSRQNLANTALFNTVTVLPLYLAPGAVMVEVTVNERWYIWPALIFDLADPNFNTWWLTKDFDRVNYGLYLFKYNFRGQNETLYVKAQFGYTRQFALRYKVPYIDRRQLWGLSLGGSFYQQDEITAGTVGNKRVLIANPDGSNRDEWKGDMELSLRRSHDVRHFWRLGYTQAEVQDTIVHVATDYFDREASTTRFLSLGYALVWDQRDVRIFPRSGHYAEARIDRLGLGVLGENEPDITTLYGTVKEWWQVQDKVTLALSVRGKGTIGTPSYYVQEGLGYTHSVRGYEYYVIDGEHFALGKGNLILQLIKPRTYRLEAMPLEAFRTFYLALYLDLFVDAGYVWDSRYAEPNFLANQWMSGYGAGLDLVTSYDQVVRGEYTLNALGEHGFFLHFTQPF